MASMKILVKGDKIALQIFSSKAQASGDQTPVLSCEHVFSAVIGKTVGEKFAKAYEEIMLSRTSKVGDVEFDDADEKDLDDI